MNLLKVYLALFDKSNSHLSEISVQKKFMQTENFENVVLPKLWKIESLSTKFLMLDGLRSICKPFQSVSPNIFHIIKLKLLMTSPLKPLSERLSVFKKAVC